jgi:catechol 2,3-dioxygenase-like lactoylglutathione lyase family enzyme
MAISHIKETCLYIKDLEKAITFYCEIMGFQIQSQVKDKHAFFRIGNTMLLLFNPDHSRSKKSPPAHFAEGKQHVAFEVSAKEYEKTKRKFISKGIPIIDEVIWANKQKSFYFEDPSGNILEIVPSGIWEN